MPDHDRYGGDPEMTDARLPERWLNDRRIIKLSDAAYRLFVTSLLWSVSNRTDGVLTDEDLDLISHVDPGRAGDLGGAGLWSRHDGRWVIADFPSTQTTRSQLDQLEQNRRMEREKKARQRARARVPQGDVPGDIAGQERQGKDRLGEEELPAPQQNE